MRGGVAEQVPTGSVIGIDTSIFIYSFERNPTYAGVVLPFLGALADGRLRGVTSVVTLTELLVRPMRMLGAEAAEALETQLMSHPSLDVRDVTREIARRAAQLRATHRLQPADSLQVATAIESGATAFLTNDLRLRRVDELPILLVDELTT